MRAILFNMLSGGKINVTRVAVVDTSILDITNVRTRYVTGNLAQFQALIPNPRTRQLIKAYQGRTGSL